MKKQPEETKEELLESIFKFFDKILLDKQLSVFRVNNYREIEDTYIDDIKIKKRWFRENKVILSKKFVPGKLIFSYNTIKNVNSNVINTYVCIGLEELKIFEKL